MISLQLLRNRNQISMPSSVLLLLLVFYGTNHCCKLMDVTGLCFVSRWNVTGLCCIQRYVVLEFIIIIYVRHYNMRDA